MCACTTAWWPDDGAACRFANSLARFCAFGSPILPLLPKGLRIIRFDNAVMDLCLVRLRPMRWVRWIGDTGKSLLDLWREGSCVLAACRLAG